jgi:hypothetical protein
LDKVGDWKDAELSTHMPGRLYTKTDDQIMEESEEVVNALEAVAQSSNITKTGERGGATMHITDYQQSRHPDNLQQRE